jgi:hypothetical protein
MTRKPITSATPGITARPNMSRQRSEPVSASSARYANRIPTVIASW